MELIVISPKGVFRISDVESVSLPGTAGRFTVLNNHAPLVSSLVAGDIVYRKGTEQGNIYVAEGFIRVCHNRIEVTAETREK